MTYRRRHVGHFKGTEPVFDGPGPEKLRAALNKEWMHFMEVRTKFSCGLVTEKQLKKALRRLKQTQKRAGIRMLPTDGQLMSPPMLTVSRRPVDA